MLSRIILAIILAGSISFNQIFAATWDSESGAAVPTPVLISEPPLANTWWVVEIPSWGSNIPESTLASYKWKIWEYTEIPCDNIEYFTQNSCNQCFDWGKKSVWEKISTLNDTWTNLNSTEQVIYKEEQILPEFVNLGWNNTKWIIMPQETSQFWKFANEIIWVASEVDQAGKQEFILDWNKTINFVESDLWASYSLESTDKKEWEPVGLLKIFAAYHDMDSSWVESVKKSNTECVAYYNATPAPVQVVTPPEVVKVKTWPEMYFLILLALLLGFAFVKTRKNKI